MQKSKKKSAKHVQLSSTFQQCGVCKVIFDVTLETHYKYCFAFKNTDPSEKGFPFEQTCIYKNVLYAKVEEFKGKVSDIAECKMEVFMHPLTMRLCKINIGGHVIIQGCKYHNLHVAFPDEKIKKTSIAFRSIYGKYYKKNESVVVYSYGEKVFEAETVIISTGSDINFPEKDLKNFLSCDLRNTFIYPGMLNYRFNEDSVIQVLIKSITGKFLSRNEDVSKIDSSFSLISDFSHVSLNDSKFEHELKFHRTIDKSVKNEESVSAEISFSSIYTTPFHSFNADSLELSSVFESFNSSTLSFESSINDIKEYFYFSPITEITIEKEDSADLSNECKKLVSPKYVGGLEKQKELVQNYFELVFDENMQGSPCGIIFHGPSGTGKTFLAKAICSEFKLNLIEINATDVYFSNYTNEDNTLKSTYKEAMDKSPCVIFIQDLDLLCEMFSANKSEMINILGDLLDKTYVSKLKILWLAKVTDINDIDKSLKKHGRFEIEIKFGVAEIQERKQILQQLLSSKKHNLSELQINDIAEVTPGFSGFLLAYMCEEAEIKLGVEHQMSNLNDKVTPDICLNYNDLKFVAQRIKPDSLRNDSFSHKKVYWKDIGGMEEIKKKLQEVVDYPIKYPEVFKRFNIQRSRGILLYGPPGCSKTMIAKALATESCLNFIPVKGPELLSKWVGDSEKAVRDLFKRAKEAAPCIIFFDEIDALVSNRGSSSGSDVDRRVVTQLLTEIDGAEELNDVVIIAATNRPNILDPAMLRPGRLDHLIYVPLPDSSTRKTIFNLKFASMPVEDGLNVDELVSKTSGYSGAEVVAVCHEAAFLALSENWPSIIENPLIKKSNFDAALKTVLPRIPKEAINFYELFSINSNLSYS